MPDQAKATVSSSEIAAIFNRSPYDSRWTLYHRWLDQELPPEQRKMEKKADDRMLWGSWMEPKIIEETAKLLSLRVLPNYGRRYSRRGHLGCTRDATIVDPSRGPGTLEVKTVWDWDVWMDKWNEGKAPPDHIYLQTQLQMAVGNYRSGPFKWGTIAVVVCGTPIKTFKIEPEPDMWKDMEAEAEAFVRDFQAKKEPPPAGQAVELPWMSQFFKFDAERVIDLRNAPLGRVAELYNAAIAYEEAKRLASIYEHDCKGLKARLLAVAQGASQVMLPRDVYVDTKTSDVKATHCKNCDAVVTAAHKQVRVNVRCPPDAAPIPITETLAEILNAG